MIRIQKDMALLLHQLVAQETGGATGVRDEGLLESALESAFTSFGGEDLYKTKEEKAARLGFSLISNHAFLDGNKRAGMHMMLTFLELNGIHMNLTDADIIQARLGVASGRISCEELLEWIIRHEE